MIRWEREREMFYLTTHSTHFIYGYMASDIWLRTILIVRKETRCRHIGYSYRLAARVLLYAPSHRQDNTYHGQSWSTGMIRWMRATKLSRELNRSDDNSTSYNTHKATTPHIRAVLYIRLSRLKPRALLRVGVRLSSCIILAEALVPAP